MHTCVCAEGGAWAGGTGRQTDEMGVDRQTAENSCPGHFLFCAPLTCFGQRCVIGGHTSFRAHLQPGSIPGGSPHLGPEAPVEHQQEPAAEPARPGSGVRRSPIHALVTDRVLPSLRVLEGAVLSTLTAHRGPSCLLCHLAVRPRGVSRARCLSFPIRRIGAGQAEPLPVGRQPVDGVRGGEHGRRADGAQSDSRAVISRGPAVPGALKRPAFGCSFSYNGLFVQMCARKCRQNS